MSSCSSSSDDDDSRLLSYQPFRSRTTTSSSTTTQAKRKVRKVSQKHSSTLLSQSESESESESKRRRILKNSPTQRSLSSPITSQKIFKCFTTSFSDTYNINLFKKDPNGNCKREKRKIRCISLSLQRWQGIVEKSEISE